jgi:hypothetical protein
VWREAWARANPTGRMLACEALHHMAWRRYWPQAPVPDYKHKQAPIAAWAAFELGLSLA